MVPVITHNLWHNSQSHQSMVPVIAAVCGSGTQTIDILTISPSRLYSFSEVMIECGISSLVLYVRPTEKQVVPGAFTRLLAAHPAN